MGQKSGKMSDWITLLKGAGCGDLAHGLHTGKLEDYNRLRDSGLPRWADFEVDYTQFRKDNKRLSRFLSKYNGFVIRAIQTSPPFNRRAKVGVDSFDECVEFLESIIDRKEEETYKVLLTQHEETDRCGIIISRDDELIIEMANGRDLAGLERGTCRVKARGVFNHHKNGNCENHFRSMQFFMSKRSHKKNIEWKILMWNALQFIRLDSGCEYGDLMYGNSMQFPTFRFLKGYFEFVVTKQSDVIKFADYKTNPAYLK